MDEFPADLVLPPGMQYWELPTGEGATVDFWGKFLGGIDTDSGDRSRWAELQLYAMIGTEPGDAYGKRAWVLYTIGHTVVYHAVGGPCSTGAETPASEFGTTELNIEDPQDLEPCPDCSPGDWRAGGLFSLEVTRYRYIPCPTAAAVIQSLHREPKCLGCRHRPHENSACSCGCREPRVMPAELTSPGRRLIEAVRALDPEIAKAAARRVRL